MLFTKKIQMFSCISEGKHEHTVLPTFPKPTICWNKSRTVKTETSSFGQFKQVKTKQFITVDEVVENLWSAV